MFCAKTLAATVQHNCHISDAHYAGHYTLCVFLLKMREYFRWEQGIPLSHPLPREALGAWLTARENLWDTLGERSFAPLALADESLDPFANDVINARLNPLGYVYSGGVGLFHKPYFFLGRLARRERQNGITLLVADQEYARDLVAPPAMLLGDTVYIRKQALRRMIWERIEEWRMKQRPDTPMARAIPHYQLAGRDTGDGMQDMESLLDRFTDNELDAVFLHEIGEVEAQRLLGPQWEQMLAALPRSRAELLARAVRDHLADCLSTLPALLDSENSASLHFYFANFTGLRRELFPAAWDGYQAWVATGSLAPLRRACDHGAEHWQRMARDILALQRDHPATLASAIESLSLAAP
jgi:hypothetical protein